MAGGGKIVRFLLVCVAFGGVAMACIFAFAAPVAAQILDPPGWTPDVRRAAPRLRPTLPADLGAASDEEQQGLDADQAGSPEGTQADSQPAEDGILEPGDEFARLLDRETEEEAAAEVETGDEPRRRVAVRQDGDPVPVIDEQPTLDGLIDVAAPAPPMEGQTNITEVDIRSPADIRAFAEPSGYDPLLLQADEYNPVFSPSTFQGFALDPFPPIGTKIGSFVLFTNLETDYDYNSNIFASPVAEGDSALEVRPAARLASNWGRHALEVRASGDLSFHDKYASEDDRAYLVEGLGRLDVTSRTNFQGLIAHEYAQESRSAINAETAGTRPNIEVTRYRGAFNQTFNRLSVQLRGNIIDTNYSSNIFDGEVQSNADRDYVLYEEAVRPKWEFSPYLFAFADIAFNQRDYSIPAYTDGILRTSTGQRYRFGVSFGDAGEILRGNISLGYGQQTPDNQELPPIDGLLIDADLAWQITPGTVLQFTAASDVAETITAGSGGVMERNYGLEARHSFTRYLVGSAGVGYMTRNFVGAGIEEDQFTAAVGSDYYLNSWAVLFARYQHTDFQSTLPQSSYTVEEVQAGVRLRH